MMKKQLSKLSKSEQEKVEKEYHRMRPDEFDQLMRHATKQVPASKPKRRNKVAEKKRAA